MSECRTCMFFAVPQDRWADTVIRSDMPCVCGDIRELHKPAHPHSHRWKSCRAFVMDTRPDPELMNLFRELS